MGEAVAPPLAVLVRPVWRWYKLPAAVRRGVALDAVRAVCGSLIFRSLVRCWALRRNRARMG